MKVKVSEGELGEGECLLDRIQTALTQVKVTGYKTGTPLASAARVASALRAGVDDCFWSRRWQRDASSKRLDEDLGETIEASMTTH